MVYQAHTVIRIGFGITMAWYWYITGLVSGLVVLSVLINVALVSEYMKVSIRRPSRTRMHVIFDEELV
jgi:DMSO reductase anchor subunit